MKQNWDCSIRRIAPAYGAMHRIPQTNSCTNSRVSVPSALIPYGYHLTNICVTTQRILPNTKTISIEFRGTYS